MTAEQQLIISSFRSCYGKLFASLLNQFGPHRVSQIEDAIQNAFYKALKTWKPGHSPKNPENWLFVVARNDLLNQLKEKSRPTTFLHSTEEPPSPLEEQDFRLQIILFIIHQHGLSEQAKVLFILKNIFGMGIREIQDSTLLSPDAIYKSLNRARKALRLNADIHTLRDSIENATAEALVTAEEILYAVFNIGFDSFDDKSATTVNKDLCLEAMALAKVLHTSFNRITTKNLLALFCFHASRIPAKTTNHRFVPFFDQNRSKWDNKLLKLGFHYMEKPDQLNSYYLEALIASKYMTVFEDTPIFWQKITLLYKHLKQLTPSPLVHLNLAYCMHRAGYRKESLILMDSLSQDLPHAHLYFSLVKAEITREDNHKASNQLLNDVMKQLGQKTRKDFLFDKMNSPDQDEK